MLACSGMSRSLRLHEHLSPLAFVKRARALKGRNVWTDGCRKLSARVPYQAAFMLRVMLMSGVLRSSSDLRESLMIALSLVLPPTLLPTFANLLKTLSDIIPAASTVSRWRLILDAAIMEHERGVNHASGSCKEQRVRYMMADSSVQHNRNFEHIVVSSMRSDALADSLQQANELTRLWRSAAPRKPLQRNACFLPWWYEYGYKSFSYQSLLAATHDCNRVNHASAQARANNPCPAGSMGTSLARTTWPWIPR